MVILPLPDVHKTRELLGGLNSTEVKYAPEVLYTAGRIELLRRTPRIAVIGSRRASERGLRNAAMIARAITEVNGVVVSGLAAGIDTAAHRAAIEAGGETIAVLGTSLSDCNPRSNRALQDQIMRQHLAISQFSPETPTTRRNFPMRNRTMALISDASIIVEAGASSGTEHQGWEAIRLGRPLLLPSSLLEADFDWPQKMLEYGALTFETPRQLRDVIDECVPSHNDGVVRAAPF